MRWRAHFRLFACQGAVRETKYPVGDLHLPGARARFPVKPDKAEDAAVPGGQATIVDKDRGGSRQRSGAKSVHTAIFTINIYGIGHNAIRRERDGCVAACGVTIYSLFLSE